MNNDSAYQKRFTDPIHTDLNLFGVERWKHDGKTYVFNRDGSVARILSYRGLNDSGMSNEERFERLLKILQAVEKLDPGNVTVQFIQRRKSVKEAPVLPASASRESLERCKMLGKLGRSKELFEDEFFIAINCYPGDSEESLVERAKRVGMWLYHKAKGETPKEAMENAYNSVSLRINKVSRLAASLKNALASTGCSAREVDDRQEIIDIYRSFLAPRKSRGKSGFEVRKDGTGIRRQLFSGVECPERDDHFLLDDVYHTVFSLDRISSKTPVYPGSVKAVMDLPMEFIYSVTLSAVTNKEAEKKFKIGVMAARQQESEVMGVSDLVAEKNTDKKIQSYDEYAESGSVAVKMSCHFVLMKDKAEVLDETERNNISVREYFQELEERLHQESFGYLGQSEWRRISRGQWIIFNNLLPGQATFRRIFLQNSMELARNAVYLLPIYENARPDIKHYGINHLFTDGKTLLNFDVFDEKSPSWTYFVSGDMGMGKSVFIHTFLAMMDTSSLVSGKPPLVRMIDYAGPAGSFIKRVKLKGDQGAILQFHKSRKPHINPLELAEHQAVPSPDKVKELVRAVESIKGVKLEGEDLVMAEQDVRMYYSDLSDHDGRLEERHRGRYLRENVGVGLDDEFGGKKMRQLLELKRGEREPNPSKMATVLTALEIMLSPEGRNDAFSRDFDREEVEEIVKFTYRRMKERDPKISDLVESAKSLAQVGELDQEIGEALVFRLSNWTTRGRRPYFDRDTDINLEADMILFDLFGLSSDPKLEMLYTMLIMDIVESDMYRKKDRSRAVVLDEAWAAMRSPAMLNLFESFMRTSRKYKFAVVSASQQPLDYLKLDPKQGSTILQQARHHVFCGFGNKHVIDEAADYFNLDEGARREMASLGLRSDPQSKVAPRFSRLMMVAVRESGKQEVSVLRNILSPYELQVAASGDDENAVLDFFMKERGMSAEQAVEHIASKGHIGDEGLFDYLMERNKPQAANRVRG